MDIEHSTDELASSIETAADAIIAASSDGVITSWNDGATALYGFTAEEAVGHPISIVMPAGRADEQRVLFDRVMQGERIQQFEAQRVAKDGTTREIAYTASPIEEADGTVVGVSMVARDVTRTRGRGEMFRSLLESAPDAIVITGTEGRIILVNRRAEEIFGYSREELIGEPIEILVPDRVRDLHSGHRVRFFLDPKVRPMGADLELFGRRKDGSEFPVEISLSPIATDEGLLVSAAVRDVTDRKAAQERFFSEQRRAEEHERRLADMRTRRRQALELNDEVVQGLTVAQLAHALGQEERTGEAIKRTLNAAQSIISQMLAEETEDGSVVEGGLRRDRAALSDDVGYGDDDDG